MGLLKEVELESGVTVKYHRVVSVTCITNVSNLIEVASYTTETKRMEEAAAIASGDAMNVFISTMCVQADYDQEMTIESAYSYIKGLPEFDGAVDVMSALSKSR